MSPCRRSSGVRVRSGTSGSGRSWVRWPWRWPPRTDAGVVHRDVKPANVLLTLEGSVKLTDFGIARALNTSGLTRTGETLGTPYYLSPEQALGRPATAASDIYALGVVAHELLTGRRPFDRDTPVATAIAHVTDPMPTLPSTIPSDLVDIIGRCLAKEPGDRPLHAREVAKAVGMPSLELTPERSGSALTTAPTMSLLPPSARLTTLLVRRGGQVLVVGSRSAAAADALCLLGHEVLGLDGDPASVHALNRSEAPAEGLVRPVWHVGTADRVTQELLGQSAGVDAVLWLGDALSELTPLERADAFRALAAVCSRQGRLVVELTTSADYTYPQFRDDFLAGGWVPDLGFSSWDLRPMTPDTPTTIVILSRR